MIGKEERILRCLGKRHKTRMRFGEMNRTDFLVETNADGTIRIIRNRRDPDAMNWAEGDRAWGTVLVPDGIQCICTRSIQENGNLREVYRFTNVSRFPVFFEKTDVGIYTTFNDNYENAQVCLSSRCHTHLFCGGSFSWCMALKMGGGDINLGLVLLAGSISSYGVERTSMKGSVVSNNRGDFILYPSLPDLAPGESTEIAWELFWFSDRADFRKKLLSHPGFLLAESENFTVFQGEAIRLRLVSKEPAEDLQITDPVTGENLPWDASWDHGEWHADVELLPTDPGEVPFEIQSRSGTLRICFYCSLPLDELVRRRTAFIAQHQQYQGRLEKLRGAYLIYDNEEKKIFYSHENDKNGGRERIGMGVLMAEALVLGLAGHAEEESLREYAEYFMRELFDTRTGQVFNDIGDPSNERLYNDPWAASFLLCLYRLWNDPEYLELAYLAMYFYYQHGGKDFYAIGIPAVYLIQEMEKAGMQEKSGILRTEFLEHASRIRSIGTDYPASEVDYEQSIVAPAADILLQAYRLTGDPSYLAAAEEHIRILLLFHGNQPDYHLYRNAIRHWDGYWFGKRRMLGDTFPHYWSVLTGAVLADYAGCIPDGRKKEEVCAMAGSILRGSLSLFRSDGSAGCAFVFPETVNGQRAHFLDPFANDQDWALCYALKYRELL